MTPQQAITLIEMASTPTMLFGSNPEPDYKRLLVLVHPDRFEASNQMCIGYRNHGGWTSEGMAYVRPIYHEAWGGLDITKEVEVFSGRRVQYTSHGPRPSDKFALSRKEVVAWSR